MGKNKTVRSQPYETESPRRSSRQEQKKSRKKAVNKDTVDLNVEPTLSRDSEANRSNVQNMSLPSTSGANSDTNRNTPSLAQFQKLSDTVLELTEIIKSLKQPQIIDNSNVSSKENSMVNETVRSNRPDMVTPTNINENHSVQFNSGAINTMNETADNADTRSVVEATTSSQGFMTSQVNQAISNHLSTLIDPTGDSDLPGNLSTQDKPVDLKVPDKLKQQIWNNQYIDLALLLDPTLEKVKPNFQFVTDDNTDSVHLATNKQPKQITSLGQWCSAFQIFITILCQKFPNQLPLLMTYMATIKNLSHKNGNYILYDQEFRYLRQTMNLPWNVTHSALWCDCRIPDNKNSSSNKQNKSKTNTTQRPSNKTSEHPNGYCFRYHNYGKFGRKSCDFTHACYNKECNNAIHPIFKCPHKSTPSTSTTYKQ